MPAKITVIDHFETNLGAAGVRLGTPFQAGVLARGPGGDGYSLIKGYMNSPQAGTLDVYQGSLADVTAVTAILPAAGAGNAVLFHTPLAHPGGAASDGTPIAIPLLGPFVVTRYTNGAAIQTSMRLHIEAAE